MKSSKYIQNITTFCTEKPHVRLLLLAILTLFSTFILYPKERQITYTYAVGDIAEHDIKAPRDFFIEDRDATLENRRKVADSVQLLYDYDQLLYQRISEKIDKAFAIPRALYPPDSETEESVMPPPVETVMTARETFQEILGISVSNGAFIILYQHGFDNDIANKIKTILTEILQNGVVGNKELLLKEEGKGIVLRTIGSSSEKVVDNLRGYYGPDQAKTMVRIIGDPLLNRLNYNLNNLIVDICQKLLRPNITFNRNATEERIQAAANKIKPVLYKIKQGEMILREGERVDPLRLIKLNTLKSQLNEKNSIISQSGLAAIILISLSVLYLVSLRHHGAMEKYHNKNLLFLSLMLLLFLSIARLALPIAEGLSFTLPLGLSFDTLYLALPLAAGSMIVCLFLGFEVAMCFSLTLAIMCSIVYSSPIEVFLYILLSSLAGAFWVKECRERKGFITAGLQLAFFNAILALILNLYSTDPRLEVMSLIKSISLTALGGITSGIITAGLAPVMEILFGYTTDIKFLELSNLDQPIMRRLMIEAPGTYNHSVIVANLAEAAASAIGANALKTKVCAFYHDIGKIDKPLYFIENQSDGKNRHDKISPSMSALVLIQHTKKGLEYAKEYKLGQDIMDTIQQHHGTSLIRYFYNKSIKINGEDAVKESDFRYPGPKPQTREAGIVMLADVVEAALRTLERPTPARIQGRVQELINAIFADGQLEECELTLKDLHHIAKSFNKILTGLYHHRIEYDNKPQETKKEKNGKPEHPDPEPAKGGGKPEPAPDKSKDPTNLKRLGI